MMTMFRRRPSPGPVRVLTAPILGVALGMAAQGSRATPPAGGAAAPASSPGAAGQGVRDTSRDLALRAGTVSTAVSPVDPASLCGPAGAGVHAVIQLDGPMTPQRRERLAAAGVVLGDYLPPNAYIASFGRADAAAVKGLEFIRWCDRYRDQWKIDPEVGARPFATEERRALAKSGRSLLAVTLFDGLPAEPAATAIAKIDGAVVHRWEVVAGNVELAVTLNTADLPRLAALPDVQFIEDAPEITLRNSNDRWIVQSNLPNVTPVYNNGIHGEGQVVGILDDRIYVSHCSFADTNPIGPSHRKILAYNTTLGSGTHGTHVAGTVVGDNGVFDDTRGVAYAGKLVYNVIPPFTESGVLTPLTQHHSQGARVHTNSWGDDGTTAYNALCRGFDAFGYANEESFVCLAVTNTSTLRNPENAKNLLAVGATQNAPNQANHCYGGTGPTSDGRRKPEIYAPGCAIPSAAAGTACGTTNLSGTSMATPAIAGSAMLVRQYFTDGYYPSGTPDPGASVTPSGALVKAVLLNSATDMTGVAGYPTNQEGWGRVLLDDALFFPGDGRRLVISDVRNAQGLATGATATLPVVVLSSSQRLKVTLAWTEPPAAAGAANATINDLDLVVSGPGGVTYLGNVFAGGVSTTGGVRDSKNNVEQVHLAAPAPGEWTVAVVGAAVNQGTQGYALAVTGDIQGAPQGLSVSLAGPPPSLVSPGTTVVVDAVINPGQDTLVPGSATLHFRYSATEPFLSVAMANVSGDLYRAAFGPCRCGDAPAFYVTAQGVEGGVRAAPLGAPANAVALTVGQTSTATLLDERFAAGLPAGWSATGLWHASSGCQVLPLCEGAPYMAYNQEPACNYNTGATNSGSLTAAPVAIPPAPPGGAVTLTYCNTVQTENVSNYDRRRLYANGVLVDSPPESPTAWETRTVDLTSMAGQTVTLRWEFDTVDSVSNAYRGWQVDNILLRASAVACTPACAVDLDGDGLVTPADLALFVNTWTASLGAGTLEGDFDRSGAVQASDIAAFVNAWLDAVAAGTCP
jgi:hypothetical protein